MYKRYDTARPQGDEGGHAFSENGIDWRVSPMAPFTESVELDDGTTITYDARQRPHLVLNADDAILGISPSGSPQALVTGLKILNHDENAQLEWMAHCNNAGGGFHSPGCDKAITHLQLVSSHN
jgi:hypothetical protein